MSSTTTEELTVIAPVHGNAPTLRRLHRRLRDALGPTARIVFVDDASPDDSRAILEALADADPGVELLALPHNAGQHRAVLAGLGRTGGAARIVVLDADLQDPPEAIPLLLERLDQGFDVVFAGRRGRYQPRSRMLTSRMFKRVLARACGVPPDAGMYLALTGEAAAALLDLGGPEPFLVAMIGRAGLRSSSVPVARAPRPEGGSAYGAVARWRSAGHALRWALRPSPAGSAATAAGRESHNELQRIYYSDADVKPGMRPRRSAYLERHVEAIVELAGLREGDRVLELGCGMGRYTLPLASRGLRVEAIDLSPALLERLSPAARAHGIPLHLGDVFDPPASLRPGFDAVVGLFVLHHVHDVEGCLQSLARLLRPGGRVAFCEPNPLNPSFYVQMLARPGMSWAGDKGIIAMRRRPLLDALGTAGFEGLRFERLGLFPPQLVDRERGAKLERLLERPPVLAPLLAFQLFGGSLATAQRPPSLPCSSIDAFAPSSAAPRSSAT